MGIGSEGYSEEGPGRTAVAVVCVVWFVLSGCLLLFRVAASLLGRSPPPLSAASCFVRLVRLCRSSISFLANADGGPVARLVAREVQARRLTRAHDWIPYGNAVAWIVVGIVFLGVTRPGPRQSSPAQDACVLVSCFIVLSLRAFPRVVTLRTLDIWSSILAACIALWVSPFAMRADFVAASALMVALGSTMILSLFNLNIKLNLVWLFVVSTSACCTIVLCSEDQLRSGEHGPPRMHTVMHVIMSAFFFGTLICCCHRFGVLVVKYEVEANFSKSELKAARSVLGCVCNVVAELDGDFRLQEESPQLADMLLLSPGRPLLGVDLRSFLASQQDHRRFSERMGRAWLQGDGAAFRVSMKDSSGASLPVEVFSVRFANREGQAAYFVGVRECADAGPEPADPEALARRRRSRGRWQQGSGVPTGLENESSQDSSGSSGRWGGHARRADRQHSDHFSQGGEEEVESVAWIDVLSPGYTIKHATPAFAQRVVQADADFLGAMNPSRRADFIDWAQEAYFALLEEDSSVTDKQYTERVHLKSRPSAQAAADDARARRGSRSADAPRQMVSASLRLDLTPLPDGQHLGGVVRIVLLDLQLGRGVPRDRRGPNPPRQPLSGTPREGTSGHLLAGPRGPEAVVLGRFQL